MNLPYRPSGLLAGILVAALAACDAGPLPPTAAADADVTAGGPGAASKAPGPTASNGSGYTLVAPVFSLATNPDGSLLAGEVLSGIMELRKGEQTLAAQLPGVSGLAPVGRGNVFALTGEALDPALEEGSRTLYRVSKGTTRALADLYAFEMEVNPDQIWNDGPPESNPFNLAHLRGNQVLIADAAANALLVHDAHGLDWVAVGTPQLASTAPFKALLGCDGPVGPPPCAQLPDAIPAQPVFTSVAVGPDGHYYVGELTGFPAEPGISRVWRIPAGTTNAVCPGPSCTLAVGGLTSIVDLTFGPDGTLYVAELDDATWLAVEVAAAGGPLTPVAGGTVKACDVGSGVCSVLATGLSLPSALTVGKDGTVWVAENAAIPFGEATVRSLP